MTEVFFEVTDPDTSVGQHPVVTLTDGITETIYHQIYVPHDFVAITSAYVIIVPAASGDMVASISSTWGKVGTEDYNTHTDSIGLTTFAVVVNDLNTIDVTAALSGIAADDLVGISITRQGGHASDSVNANCYYLGIRLRYS